MRGRSKARTLDALRRNRFGAEADRLEAAFEKKSARWEDYARATFEAHCANVPPEKLRFLQYVTPESAEWWKQRRRQGAILLGKTAKVRGLTTLADPGAYGP